MAEPTWGNGQTRRAPLKTEVSNLGATAGRSALNPNLMDRVLIIDNAMIPRPIQARFQGPVERFLNLA
jgi:hypothetical protein